MEIFIKTPMNKLQNQYLRDLYYLKNSAEDSIDFVLNSVLFIVGIFVFTYQEIFTDSPANYSFFITHNIQPLHIAITCIISSTINFIRLFYPFKLRITFVSFLKSITLFCFAFIFISTIHKAPLSILSVTYLVLTLFSFRSVLKAK